MGEFVEERRGGEVFEGEVGGVCGVVACERKLREGVDWVVVVVVATIADMGGMLESKVCMVSYGYKVAWLN